jgi:hypothetical protein
VVPRARWISDIVSQDSSGPVWAQREQVRSSAAGVRMGRRRPNVLVVMTDQQKATASHLYGSEFGITPSMEKLAQRGTIYDVACT